MKKDGLIKGIMLAAGFVAVIGILCSQPFFASKTTAKASTGQADEKQGETIIQVYAIGPWGLTYVNARDDPRNQ